MSGSTISGPVGWFLLVWFVLSVIAFAFLTGYVQAGGCAL